MILRFAALALLAILTSPVGAQTGDAYAPARAIVADIGKIVSPNGVQETFQVTLGGARQIVNVRGSDRDNPILIFVHGGPGAVEMPFAWAFQRPWEDVFTVVQYDQRGAGRSYPLNDPTTLAPTLTPERYRDDAIELIELLKKRYGKRKVVLMGHSWGSIVGLSVAVKRPDLLYAYVGVGQGINFRDGEKAGMAWTRAQAVAAGNAEAVAAIDALAPYPQGEFTIAKADGWRKYAIPYGSLIHNKPDLTYYFQTPRLSPEYTEADRQAWGRGSEFSVTTLWPRLADVSFKSVHKLDVPIVFLLGRHDYTVPSPVAAEWFAQVKAPSKRLIWLEHSAHMPMVEEPGHFFAALLRDVLPLAKAQ
ncbi:alpha/beta fold hydrolase [Sphingopyxis sp. JAI128]|uniref:alpha/beta fold hydrolase n=1 Tax=Sphingopyxis sp. JAI128 TaxID=2723066 RepID=UPI00160A72C9|nr:alpha/beta hydrolase [Sphingopyxis sp. JAI128]MBB6427001.1 pimeloyl-ACP methyl ester carboxylesterase [Sphingopyxis sp. JAI128]